MKVLNQNRVDYKKYFKQKLKSDCCIYCGRIGMPQKLNNVYVESLKLEEMKKFLFSTLLVFACSIGVATAQLQKGSTLVGGGIADLNLGLGDDDVFTITLTPRVGYFIQDNVAVGGKVGLTYTAQPGEDAYAYNVNAFGRYYFGEKEFNTLLKQGRWFLEAGAGIGGAKGADVGFNVNFGPGYAYFLTDNIAVEGLLLYNGIFGDGSSNGLSLNVGFQIYFPRSMYKSLK